MMLSDRARAFLAQERFAVLATINKNGLPQQSTMWYELRGDEILMNTAAGRLKDRNLRRDPRVSICFEDEYSYITITGTAQLIDDQETAQADIAHLAIRYHGEEEGRKQAEESFSKQTRVSIRVKIEHILERF
jgi:PPOX class probable F420-dependent enzyme